MKFSIKKEWNKEKKQQKLNCACTICQSFYPKDNKVIESYSCASVLSDLINQILWSAKEKILSFFKAEINFL